MSAIGDVQIQAKKRAAAMVAGDVEGVAALLDERLLYTHSSGLTDTRESYVAMLRQQEYTYHSVETVKVDHSFAYGPMVFLSSLMAVSMSVRSSGQTVSRQIKVTEVWASNSRGWRLLISHSTNVA
jgi:hypothetical protein